MVRRTRKLRKFGGIALETAKLLLSIPGINRQMARTARKTSSVPTIIMHGGNNDLIKAAKDGDTTRVTRLINMGSDVNFSDKEGLTPLFAAIIEGHSEVVKLLLSQPDININNTWYRGDTPLIFALEKSVEIVQLLLSHPDIDVNVQSKTEEMTTPLYYACSKGYNKSIKLLISHSGIDVNKPIYYGETPLSIAVFQGYKTAVALLLSHPDIDVNKADHNGETPLWIAAESKRMNIVKLLLADPRIVIDRKTREYIKHGKFRADIAKLILNSIIIPSKPWKGFTQSDVSLMDTVFETNTQDGQKPPAENWSACPVCLKYVERSDACKYMKHDCSIQEGYYHNELYSKYADRNGMISWCTICGRICRNHNHYELAMHNAPIPSLAKTGPDANAFASYCRQEGGGGLEEKVIRFRKLREQAKALNAYVGELTEKDAYNFLVEEMWNAPVQIIVGTVIAKKLMEKKAWNIPATNFLPNTVTATAPNVVSNAVNAVRPSLNLEILKPVILPAGEDMFGDEGPLIQFHHRQGDGTVNNHDKNGSYDLITPESLTEVVKRRNKNFSEPNFGYCISYPTNCKARLYPDEIKEFIPVDVYEEYRKKFNRKFGT